MEFPQDFKWMFAFEVFPTVISPNFFSCTFRKFRSFLGLVKVKVGEKVLLFHLCLKLLNQSHLASHKFWVYSLIRVAKAVLLHPDDNESWFLSVIQSEWELSWSALCWSVLDKIVQHHKSYGSYFCGWGRTSLPDGKVVLISQGQQSILGAKIWALHRIALYIWTHYH